MIKSLLLSFIVLIGMTTQVYALSCVPFEINQETIGETDIIFEGTVIEAKEFKGNADPSNLNRTVPFRFNIDTLWKSDFDNTGIDTQNIKIIRNIYWGGAFTQGQSYLIFANKNNDGEYEAGLCGASTRSDYADETKDKLMKILNKTNEDK